MPRRLTLLVAGLVSALGLAAAPGMASADTGHLIPVRENVKRAVDPAHYLARVPGAHVFVVREDGEVLFAGHDPGLTAGTHVIYALFNHPENCNPAITPGKLDPQGRVVSLCDPGVDGGNPATGLSVVAGPAVTPDARGNFRLTLAVGQGPVLGPPGTTGLTNPRGAEISVVLGSHYQIFISSPRLERGDDSETGHARDGD